MIVSSLFLLASIMMLILSTVPEFQVPAIYLIMKAKSPTTWLMAKHLNDPTTKIMANHPKYQNTQSPNIQLPKQWSVTLRVYVEMKMENAHLSDGSVV